MIKSIQLKGIFWVAVITWAAGLLLTGTPLSEALFKPAGAVLGVITALVTLFERWMWRWKWFHPWFVSTPNLNGSYKGAIEPLSELAKKSGGREQIEAYLSIHQTLSTITVRLYTEESESISVCSDLRSSEDNHWALRYTYENVPDQKVRGRSPIHFGGVSLAIDGEGYTRLRGGYWTDRLTNGVLQFERFSRKPARSFKEAGELQAQSKK